MGRSRGRWRRPVLSTTRTRDICIVTVPPLPLHRVSDEVAALIDVVLEAGTLPWWPSQRQTGDVVLGGGCGSPIAEQRRSILTAPSIGAYDEQELLGASCEEA